LPPLVPSFIHQLITEFHRIFRASGERLFLRPYAIVATSPDAGLIEAVPDTISLDALREKTRYASHRAHRLRLRGVFERMFGPAGSRGFRVARDNFVESLAAYSIVCYLLQVRGCSC
jgi:phosphatidylinositol 4-kinase